MSNTTRKKVNLRTPLSQLHNATPLSSEKLSMTQDSISKQILKSYSQNYSFDNLQEESEYVKVLRKALEEATNENEALRNRVIELEALLSAAQDEIEQKDKAILELAEILEVQKMIKRKETILEGKPKKKRSLSS